MNSRRTLALRRECDRLSTLQRKSSGARYVTLDQQWSRIAALLHRSRIHDAVGARRRKGAES